MLSANENISLSSSLAGVLSEEVNVRYPSTNVVGMADQWMPREQWDALVRGEGCPLCAAVAAEQPADEYGYTVADLSLSRLRLAANQFVPGYCVLICARHVREPYDLGMVIDVLVTPPAVHPIEAA